MQPFQITSVLKELKSPKNNIAAGLDNTTAYLLKSAAHVIAPLLPYIYNFPLSSSVFPHNWKEAKIIPVLRLKKINRKLSPDLPIAYFGKIFE